MKSLEWNTTLKQNHWFFVIIIYHHYYLLQTNIKLILFLLEDKVAKIKT